MGIPAAPRHIKIINVGEAILTRAQVIWCHAAFLLFLPSLVFAGSFRVVPIKLYLDARSKTEVLKILNEGDKKVTVQLNAKGWSQDETGKDVYEEKKDIVFFPKITDIEKGEERIVRVGYQGKTAASVEKTYRLFLAELPVVKPGELALKFALRLSIPIFVKPQKEIKEWAIDGLKLSEKTLTVKVKNSGNTHISVSKITAMGFDDSGKEVFSREIAGWYALAGGSKPFAVGVSREECMGVKTIKVTVEVKKTTKESTLDVDKNMCTPKKEDSKDVKRGIEK